MIMVMQNVPVSSWQRKHDAIGAAALTLFARDGYERTSVDAIAAEAGVSKRTVYSHYGDKENLFLQVLRETYDVMRDRVRDIVDRNLRDVDSVQEALTACIGEIVQTISRAPEGATLIRLIHLRGAAPPRDPAAVTRRNRGIGAHRNRQPLAKRWPLPAPSTPMIPRWPPSTCPP